jgi:ADP-ribose pyrophosphatase
MDEKIISTEKIYAGRVIGVDVHRVLLPNGMEQIRELVHHPGATAIVAVDAQGLILMVRQFRIAAGKVMSEIPAGTLHIGEPPIHCAIRELQEETGFKPGHIEPLGGFFVAPGYTTEYIHLYLATDLSESKLPGDEDEFIQVQRVSLLNALSMIENGEIVDGKTIIGLLRYARHKAIR